MPIVEVPGLGRVEFPDGTSEADMTAAIQQAVGIKPEPPSGFIRGLRDPLDAGAQMLERVTPARWAQFINQANNWLADRGVPLQRMPEGGLQQQLSEDERAYQEQRAAAGETGFDWARLGGNLVSPANLAIASRVPGAASAAGRLAAGAGGGAVLGAMAQPVPEAEDFWTEKAKQAGGGALFSGVLSALGQAIGYVGRQARRPEVAALRAKGVEPTIGETIGGAAARVEEKLGSVPILGDAIANARQRARLQFNEGAINEALAPLGVSIRGAAVNDAAKAISVASERPPGVPGQQVVGPVAAKVEGAGQSAVDEAHKLVSSAYERAAGIVPGIKLDQTAVQEIKSLRSLLKGATAETERDFGRFFRNTFQRKLGGAVGFETRNFKELDSLIGKRVAAAKNNKELGDAFRELQRILRAQAGRSSPEYAKAQAAADEAYKRLVRIEDAAKRAALQEGVFTPGQLLGAIRSNDPTVRRNATARGQALMQEYATAGQNVLGNVVPNSGTVDRGLVAAALAAPFDPLLAGGIALGPLLYTPQAQALLTGLARQAPEFTGTAGAAFGGLFGGLR